MRYNKKYLKKGSGKNEYNSYNENENENHNYERFFNAKNGLNNGSSFDFNHVNGLNNGSSFDFNHENGLNNGSSFDFNHENNESSLYNKTSFNPENNRNGLNNGSSFDFNHVNNESSLYNKTSFNPENNINGLNIKKANPVVLVNNENSKKTNNLVFNKIKIQTEYILNKNVKIDLVKIFFMFKNNNNQDVKIKIDWGSEKRFRYYLDILIKELIPNKSLKQFKSEHTNIRTIDLLGKLWDIVLNDKNPIYIQSDFYLLILETKIKNFKNTNQNENLQKYFILLNNIIEFIKNKNFENIDNLVNEFYELDINQQIINHQEMLSFN